MAIVERDCKIREGRQLIYNKIGTLERLITLDDTFTQITSSRNLNPPIPLGKDPGGIPVALVDTGVNYTLGIIEQRLARDNTGQLLGYDFWDMDKRPFDLDTSRSPFFPFHHGTSVASILIREAPTVRIVPYRFPRYNMHRMRDLIFNLNALGVRIVHLAMGSNDRKNWEVFETTARKVPDVLFVVSAGNNNRDLDSDPVYPASLGLENLLVVTSANNFGQLAKGSNWGRKSVHIMVPGEQISVIDHQGMKRKASGSSFAVPRVVALAARLLAKNPDWQAAEIKNAILSKAILSPYEPRALLSHGWISDPTDDFLP